jgi:hypothetical protein
MNVYGTYEQISVVDSIHNEVAKMAAKVLITDIVKVDNVYRVTCENTRRLVDYMYITISDTVNFNGTYRIENVTSTTFDIKNTYLPQDEININGFYNLKVEFVHGSYNSMYQQLENLTKYEKTQVVCLHEPITTRVTTPPNGVYKVPTLRLIFCTPYYDSWTENEHDLYAVKPLMNLVDLFVNFANIQNYTEEVRKRYGKFNLYKGSETHLLGKVDAIEITDAQYTIYAKYKC